MLLFRPELLRWKSIFVTQLNKTRIAFDCSVRTDDDQTTTTTFNCNNTNKRANTIVNTTGIELQRKKTKGLRMNLKASLLAIFIVAILFGTMSASCQTFSVANYHVCKETANLEECKSCCVSQGYNANNSIFGRACVCYIDNRRKKVRKSDIVYQTDEHNVTMDVIEREELEPVSCWSWLGKSKPQRD